MECLILSISGIAISDTDYAVCIDLEKRGIFDWKWQPQSCLHTNTGNNETFDTTFSDECSARGLTNTDFF